MSLKDLSATCKYEIKKEWKAVVVISIACLVQAFAVHYFTLYYHFPDLGISGLAVLSYYLFNISPSWIILICNILLLIWGRRELSDRFLILTVISVGAFSLGLSLFEFLDIKLSLPEDKFMATLITGLLKGISTGIIFNIGGSTGGLDIIAMVVRRRHGVEVGQFSILVNLIILALSIGIVGLEAVVYGAAGLYVNGITLDNVTRSFDKRKQAFIITNIPDEVSEFINSKGKGVTRLEGIGTYTGKPRSVLISLLEPRQVVQLKLFLKECDPHAFVSICDASEVLGQGFKSWRSL